jgi:hypothetical protein
VPINEPLDSYTVTVTGDGTRVEKTVPTHVAIEVIRLVAAVEARHSRAATIRGGRGLKEHDLAEFIEECVPTNNAERVAATAMFLREQGYLSFDREFLRSTMRKGRLTVPKNLPRDVASARANGWVEENPLITGELSLTEAGIAAVTSRFGRPNGP